MNLVMKYIEYFLEHLDELLLRGEDPEVQAMYFAVLFNLAPTYEEINSGTPDLAECIKLKDAYAVSESNLAGD